MRLCIDFILVRKDYHKMLSYENIFDSPLPKNTERAKTYDDSNIRGVYFHLQKSVASQQKVQP